MKIEEIKNLFAAEIESCKTSKSFEELRIKYLGKKGLITSLMKELSNEEKALLGKELNLVKTEIIETLNAKKVEIAEVELRKKLKSEMIDVTVPGFQLNDSFMHPLRFMERQIWQVFMTMGFQLVYGPEVESDYYNFELLNMPKDHPAREMHDTFYFNEEFLLRTHTSPVQIRHMLSHASKGPVRIISPGKVYRRDDDDATHSHQFMQMEGLLIDENISMAHLKGILEVLVKKIFGENRTLRLRPSFFPFTEPSVEVDIDCFKCDGKGCALCKGTGYIEVLGAGMVHASILEEIGYDTDKYSGFAFGIGIERFCMLKYNIEDIRDFYRNDIRFLKKFAASNVRGGRK